MTRRYYAIVGTLAHCVQHPNAMSLIVLSENKGTSSDVADDIERMLPYLKGFFLGYNLTIKRRTHDGVKTTIELEVTADRYVHDSKIVITKGRDPNNLRGYEPSEIYLDHDVPDEVARQADAQMGRVRGGKKSPELFDPL